MYTVYKRYLCKNYVIMRIKVKQDVELANAGGFIDVSTEQGIGVGHGILPCLALRRCNTAALMLSRHTYVGH